MQVIAVFVVVISQYPFICLPGIMMGMGVQWNCDVLVRCLWVPCIMPYHLSHYFGFGNGNFTRLLFILSLIFKAVKFVPYPQ
jgi:phage shock protein PspC (stress-responsive transcriptional regulator)